MTAQVHIIRKEGALVAALDLRLCPAGGRRDAALFDALAMPDRDRSDRLTAVIEAGFLRPDGAGPGWALAMSVTDRQIALYRLALDHGRWPAWFVSRCEHCDTPADLRVGRDEFAITPGATPLPARITLGDGRGDQACFALPTGTHETALAHEDTDLAALCLLDEGADLGALAAAFDQILEALLPSITTELRFLCPSCGQETGYWFDPMDWIARHTGQCLIEVDRLARAYGWSEASILRMPEPRRHSYLALLGEPV